MKSKKLLAVILTAAMLLSFAACSESEDRTNSQDSAPSSSQGAEKNESSKQDGKEYEAKNDDGNGLQIGEPIVGKVLSAAGNELKLGIGNIKQDEDDTISGDVEGEGDFAAFAMTPAGGGNETGGEGVDRPKIELEYTGEEAEFVIPAGAVILGPDGQKTTMDAIKKGSVLMLMFDAQGNMTGVNILE